MKSLFRKKIHTLDFPPREHEKSLTSRHALTRTSGGYKAPLQTEQCKAPLPNSVWALQAVSQLHAVSFICFFQIGFLFNRRKAFILMAPLGLSPGKRATPDSCGMGRDGTGWSGSCSGQGFWGASLCVQATVSTGTFQPLLPFSKAQRNRGNLHFFFS